MVHEIEPRTFDYRVAELVRAVDGDTYILRVSKAIDFGFYLVEEKSWTGRFRLEGLDTPEARDAGGAEATRFATAWILEGIADDVLRGQTYKDSTPWGVVQSFGRFKIDLYRDDTGEQLRDALRIAGHVKPV